MIAAIDRDTSGQIGLVIAFAAFVAVLVDITLLRRRAEMEHDLNLPLEEARRVSPEAEKGADTDVA